MVGAFQGSAFQCDDIGSIGRTRVRHYYEIRGQLYLLDNEELEFLVRKLVAQDKVRKIVPKAVRVKVPKKWEPPEEQVIVEPVWNDLMVEAQSKNYWPIITLLNSFRPPDDDAELLLLTHG